MQCIRHIEAAANRYKNYNDSVEKLIELENNKDIFVIRPSKPIEIGRLEKDPEKLQKVYDLGYNDARKSMDGLREYLK